MMSPTLTFRLRIPGQAPLVRIRSFEGRDQVEAYVARLLAEWPECEAIEILHEGEVVDLFVQSRKPS